MNSLSELNNWNTTSSYEFEGIRLATVTFVSETVVNPSIIVNEGSAFASPVGVDILEVINPNVSEPRFSVNINNAPAGTTLTWPASPAGTTTTQVGSIYTILGIDSAAIWDQIKNPVIALPATIPNAFYGTFSYTCTLYYNDEVAGQKTKTWTVAVTVLDVTILNTPLEFAYGTNTTTQVTTPPNIVFDEWPGVTWTLTGTPTSTVSITNWTTSGTGGTFSVNATTKAFTATGTTAQINSLMNGLSVVTNTITSDFSVYYLLTNNQSSASDTKQQLFKNTDTRLFSNPLSPTIFYAEDAETISVSNGPQITDTSYTGDGNYSVVVKFSNTAPVTAMSSTGSSGSSEYNPTTKQLTIVGQKSAVNEHLQQISVSFINDFAENNILFYNLSTPLGDAATKAQTLICNTSDTEISNMTVTRTYTSNNSNLIFATSTPQVIDLDTDPENIYSIVLDCSFGTWGTGNEVPVNPYVVTGTRSQVNAAMANVKFYPNAGISSNGTFTFGFIKNDVNQFTQTAVLNGSAGTYQGARIISLLVTGTWTPTPEDVRYGKYDLLVVGGGGSGGRVDAQNINFAGAGGAGGEVKTWTDLLFEEKTYSYTVGPGGGTYVFPPESNTEYRRNGQSSSFDIYLANGGQGAVNYRSSGDWQNSPGKLDFFKSKCSGASSTLYSGGDADFYFYDANIFYSVTGGGASSEGPGGSGVLNTTSQQTLSQSQGGNGANGKLITLFGSNEYYGGGGGGAGLGINTSLDPFPGNGGLGGGGQGASGKVNYSVNGGAGTANTGGGGGGIINGGGAGGSGVVKLRIKAR